jgi:hypothetical protein
LPERTRQILARGGSKLRSIIEDSTYSNQKVREAAVFVLLLAIMDGHANIVYLGFKLDILKA